MLGGSRSDPYRMCWRADGVQVNAPLSSMGPADMVPCLELSVAALKCREKSVRKVHTSSYKCTEQEIGSHPTLLGRPHVDGISMDWYGSCRSR